MLAAQTIKNQHSDVFTFLHGNLESAANHCRIPEESCLRSLVYASDLEQLEQLSVHYIGSDVPLHRGIRIIGERLTRPAQVSSLTRTKLWPLPAIGL